MGTRIPSQILVHEILDTEFKVPFIQNDNWIENKTHCRVNYGPASTAEFSFPKKSLHFGSAK